MLDDLELIFHQTYDGTIKRDTVPESDILSFAESESIYLSKMDIFMKSQDASEVMNVT